MVFGLSEIIASIILITVEIFHIPLLATLIVTSLICLVSGTIGYKMEESNLKSRLFPYFLSQIAMLAVWDFGGVICVLDLVFKSRNHGDYVLAITIIVCCAVYIGIFIYLWSTFLVTNKLLQIHKKTQAIKLIPNRVINETRPPSLNKRSERAMREF
jgi:uncharacterized membrane protein